MPGKNILGGCSEGQVFVSAKQSPSSFTATGSGNYPCAFNSNVNTVSSSVSASYQRTNLGVDQPSGTFEYTNACCFPSLAVRGPGAGMEPAVYFNLLDQVTACGGSSHITGIFLGRIEIFVDVDDIQKFRVTVELNFIADVISTFIFPLSGGSDSETITIVNDPMNPSKDYTITLTATLS